MFQGIPVSPHGHSPGHGKRRYHITHAIVIGFFGLELLISGCSECARPRYKLGAYFGCITGIRCLNMTDLVEYKYDGNPDERDGLIYTCKGGFIDMGHLREAVDRTKYLFEITYQNVKRGQREFSFQAIEPAMYQVNLDYPAVWDQLEPAHKEILAREISIDLGQYFAQTSMIWHEIITWFGYSSMAVFSENISSFSWEDSYSDFLGTYIAAKALRDKDHDFEKTVTRLMHEELLNLDAQASKITQEAINKINGKWYKHDLLFVVNMVKRNFNTGIDDGSIEPWLIPGICNPNQPQSYPVPAIDSASTKGFTIRLKLLPREFEKDYVLKMIGDTEIQPEIHFNRIINQIREQAIQVYGNEVDVPVL